MIARNPQKKIDPKAQKKTEAKAGKFIAGNGARKSRDLAPVLIKFDRAFLERVDQAAQGRGLNRTGWIIAVLGDRLAELEAS